VTELGVSDASSALNDRRINEPMKGADCPLLILLLFSSVRSTTRRSSEEPTAESFFVLLSALCCMARTPPHTPWVRGLSDR
jgi:hypothetical protein